MYGYLPCQKLLSEKVVSKIRTRDKVIDSFHKLKGVVFRKEGDFQKEKVEYVGLKESIIAIKSSLKLLDESEKFLEEQTKISHSLFKNGLINALQYVEVLSRRVDLIKSKSQAENQLIEVHSQLAKISNAKKSEGENL
jgi:hypothetical protein